MRQGAQQEVWPSAQPAVRMGLWPSAQLAVWMALWLAAQLAVQMPVRLSVQSAQQVWAVFLSQLRCLLEPASMLSALGSSRGLLLHWQRDPGGGGCPTPSAAAAAAAGVRRVCLQLRGPAGSSAAAAATAAVGSALPRHLAALQQHVPNPLLHQCIPPATHSRRPWMRATAASALLVVNVLQQPAIKGSIALAAEPVAGVLEGVGAAAAVATGRQLAAMPAPGTAAVEAAGQQYPPPMAVVLTAVGGAYRQWALRVRVVAAVGLEGLHQVASGVVLASAQGLGAAWRR